MGIGERIRNARKKKEMTQKLLGQACGIDEANIRKYEADRQNPKLETLQKIASALDVPVDYLLGWDSTVQQAKEAAANTPDDAVSDVETDDIDIFDRICQLTGHYARPKLDDLSGYYLGRRGDESSEVFLSNKEFRALIKRIAAATAAMLDSEIEVAKDDTLPK